MRRWHLALTVGIGALGALVRSRASRAEPLTVSSPQTPLVIFAGGDVSFGREVGQRVLRDPNYSPFSQLAPLWRDADLRFVNLESQLSEQHGETQSPERRLVFTGPPVGAAVLARAGVALVSTANNHAWDYGRNALFETLHNLDAAGVQHAGTGQTLDDAYRPVRFELKGQRITWFAVTHVWNYGPLAEHDARNNVAWANVKRLTSALKAARADSDLLLVSYHGGAEYNDCPSDITRSFTKAVIAAGADVVIGHHPHVLQGVGWIDRHPIFYSLGNLVFGARSDIRSTRYGVLVKLVLDSSSTRHFALCPYQINDFEPTPFDLARERAEHDAVIAQIRRASTSTGGTRFGDTDEQGCVEVLPPR